MMSISDPRVCPEVKGISLTASSQNANHSPGAFLGLPAGSGGNQILASQYPSLALKPFAFGSTLASKPEWFPPESCQPRKFRKPESVENGQPSILAQTKLLKSPLYGVCAIHRLPPGPHGPPGVTKLGVLKFPPSLNSSSKARL